MKELIVGGIKTWSSYAAAKHYANVYKFKYGYILNSEFFDYKIFVLKDSKEYEHLNKMIDDEDEDGILEYADGLVLKNLKTYELKYLIKELIKKEGLNEYERGYKDAQARIRNALGI